MDQLIIPVKDQRPIDQFFDELISLVELFKTVALTSTVQFKHQVPKVTSLLKDHEVVIGPSVLGCSSFSLESDCTVIIATGVFHAINIAIKSGKPVFIIGPSGVSRLDESLVDSFLRKQSIRASKVLDADCIGVLVSTKSGQEHESLGEQIVSQLRNLGKEAYLFVANELSALQLNDFPVDAWINTACPRIVEDEFDKPIANWAELKEFFN